jgi:hypothetical protein
LTPAAIFITTLAAVRHNDFIQVGFLTSQAIRAM